MSSPENVEFSPHEKRKLQHLKVDVYIERLYDSLYRRQSLIDAVVDLAPQDRERVAKIISDRQPKADRYAIYRGLLAAFDAYALGH